MDLLYLHDHIVQSKKYYLVEYKVLENTTNLSSNKYIQDNRCIVRSTLYIVINALYIVKVLG